MAPIRLHGGVLCCSGAEIQCDLALVWGNQRRTRAKAPRVRELSVMTVSPVLFRPQSLAEALDLLATHPDAKPISGGASLVPMMNADLVAPAVLVSLTRIPELSGITVTEAGDIRIGAATRHS